MDVRILAATNVNLKEKIKSNEFREDLYYRLNIINIHLPPLRERKEDIPLLVEHFLDKYAKENKKKIKGVDKKFMKSLMDYTWPGNIRELENAIIRAVLLSSSNVLSSDFLLNDITESKHMDLKKGDFYKKLDEFKRQLIIEALEKNNWVQKKSAKDLGLKPTTLSELMKRLDILR